MAVTGPANPFQRLLGHPDALESIGPLDQFVRSKQFNAAILQLIDDEVLCGNLAARSYVHVNGFRKLILADAGKTGGEVRLHEWLPSDGERSDKHDHPWPYASHVLRGTLINQSFVEAPGRPHRRCVIGPVGGGRDGYHYIDDAVVDLALTSEASLSAGSTYLMTNAIIHNAFAPAGAATLVLQGPFRKEVTFGYRPLGCAERGPSVQRLSRDEFTAALRTYLD